MLVELEKRDKTRSIQTVETDIFNLQTSLRERQFDGAVSRWVLPHFPDWPEITKCVHGTLKTNGIFVFDLPHREHVQYALEKYAVNYEEFGYNHSIEPADLDPAFFYAAETTSNLRKKLAASGFELLERVPYGLFKSNLLLFGRLGAKKSRKISNLLSFGLRWHPLFREFLQALENEIVVNLPPELAHGSFVVCRKI